MLNPNDFPSTSPIFAGLPRHAPSGLFQPVNSIFKTFSSRCHLPVASLVEGTNRTLTASVPEPKGTVIWATSLSGNRNVSLNTSVLSPTSIINQPLPSPYPAPGEGMHNRVLSYASPRPRGRNVSCTPFLLCQFAFNKVPSLPPTRSPATLQPLVDPPTAHPSAGT